MDITITKKLSMKKEYDIIVCGGGVAGVAAALAASHAMKEKTGAASVGIRKLQDAIEKENIMVHFPDAYLPEDRTVCIHGKNAAEIDGGHF